MKQLLIVNPDLTERETETLFMEGKTLSAEDSAKLLSPDKGETATGEYFVSAMAPQPAIDYLACHNVDEWWSICYYSKEQKQWFNSYDNDCPCHPTHIMSLPILPTPPTK